MAFSRAYYQTVNQISTSQKNVEVSQYIFLMTNLTLRSDCQSIISHFNHFNITHNSERYKNIWIPGT